VNYNDHYTHARFTGQTRVSSSYVLSRGALRNQRIVNFSQWLTIYEEWRLSSGNFSTSSFLFVRLVCSTRAPTCSRSSNAKICKSTSIMQDLSTYFVAGHQVRRGHFLVPFTSNGLPVRRVLYLIASGEAQDLPEVASKARRTSCVYGL